MNCTAVADAGKTCGGFFFSDIYTNDLAEANTMIQAWTVKQANDAALKKIKDDAEAAA